LFHLLIGLPVTWLKLPIFLQVLPSLAWFFLSAGLSPVSASPDSSFSPACELSARAAADFHFDLHSGSEVFVGFNLDFSDSFFSLSAQLQ
jgi:hypothetical protein